MKREEKQLAELFRLLSEQQQDSLLDFARYMASRNEVATTEESFTPLDIQRPENESVVKAIQRLSASYPMLEKSSLLSETTELMSQHVIGGRDAMEVIDELELLFRTHYEKFRLRGQPPFP